MKRASHLNGVSNAPPFGQSHLAGISARCRAERLKVPLLTQQRKKRRFIDSRSAPSGEVATGEVIQRVHALVVSPTGLFPEAVIGPDAVTTLQLDLCTCQPTTKIFNRNRAWRSIASDGEACPVAYLLRPGTEPAALVTPRRVSAAAPRRRAGGQSVCLPAARLIVSREKSGPPVLLRCSSGRAQGEPL